MTDLRNPKLLYMKGIVFLLAGLLSGGLIIADHPTLRTAALLALAIWCFCRAYYFAFYVIQHYIDPHHHYAGLLHFARYAPRRR